MVKNIQKYMFLNTIVSVVLLLNGYVRSAIAVEFPGPPPGDAKGEVHPDILVLENDVLACNWDISEERLKLHYVINKLSKTKLQLKGANCFQIVLGDGRRIEAADMKIVGKAELKKLQSKSNSPRLAERFGGLQISVRLASSDNNLEIEWSAVLRDGSNYVRQQVSLRAKNKPIEIKEIVLLELAVAGAKVMGMVDGSPVVASNMFFACENPISKSQIVDKTSGRFRCSLPYTVILKPSNVMLQTSVIGVAPKGQLRRAFLYYLERERAHPYRPFLHYNSWYDIAWWDRKMQEKQCLDAIEQLTRELIEKRGVTIDSFVFDDGWDDNRSLWRFHEGFPNGFSPLRQKAEKYGVALGTWLSPFGGYGKPRAERLKYGREQGFETNRKGFSLAGPKYYGRFREVCVKMQREYDLNYFKLDGIASEPNGATAKFAPDVAALLRLVAELRASKPDLFVNITVGTWPSPYWLWYCDSTWRGGRDWGTHGWGSKRQQWITFRDKETYHNIIRRGPLYPANSLMLHGVTFAQLGSATKMSNELNDLIDEIRTFFGSGTCLQEMYITPGMMGPRAWDVLAEAAKWARENADVLIDTHWIGGDPAKGEIYGWASWSKYKGILMLRNPNETPGSITIDIAQVFELPGDAAMSYVLKSPWKEDAEKAAITLSAGKGHKFELKPFEVLVFDAIPQGPLIAE